jgi:ParB family transcriptional regulator, chromosome partitioning protein
MDKKRSGAIPSDLLNGDAELLARDETAVEMIERNPYQPRKHFDKDELSSLSASIKSHGILQPILVRMMGNHFQLVAGERRLRAAQEAGIKRVPIHVVDFNDQQAYEAALVENIQRSDLNPIEKALGFKDYLDRFKLNHDQLANRLGLARPTITNLINLLELAPEVQDGIRLNQITEAHAKVLKGIKNKERQVAMFKQIVAMGLSVKAAESLLRDQKSEPPAETNGEREPAEVVEKTAHVKGLEDELRKKLATPVEIKLRAKDKGQFVLRFETNDDFERILEVLRK